MDIFKGSLIIISLVLASITASAHEMRGFVCEPVPPLPNQEIVDFSQKGALDNASWHYQFIGDSIASVQRFGQGKGVREDYFLKGDTAWLTCREGRVWVSYDSLPATVYSPTATKAPVMRKIRRFQSEYYIARGDCEYTPLGICTVILAEGDTVRNATLTHRRETIEILETDITYTVHDDSIRALVTKDVWNWCYGYKSPLLACTEITVTEDRRTGLVHREEWSAVFPRHLNPDVWPQETQIAQRTRSFNRAGNTSDFDQKAADSNNPLPDNEPRIELTDGIITINTGSTEQPIVITDVAGRVMHSSTAAGTVTIATNGWPYGEYVVKSGPVTRKIILMP